MGLLTQKVRVIDRGIRNTGWIFGIVGACLLFLMMVLGFADVAGRYLLNSPIKGGLEITKIFMLGVVVLSWAYTQAARGHIRVDFVVNRFPPRARAILSFASDLFLLGFFSLIAWRAAAMGIVCWERHQLTAIINVPVAIMYFVVSLGSCVMCLTLITQLGSFAFGDKNDGMKA